MRHPTEKSPAVPTGNRLSLFSRGLGWLRFRGPPSLQLEPHGFNRGRMSVRTVAEALDRGGATVGKVRENTPLRRRTR